MSMAQFGGAETSNYSIDFITGWLEAIIMDEESECENSSSIHRAARLERAQDALDALYEVAEWTPRLTKHHQSKKPQPNR